MKKEPSVWSFTTCGSLYLLAARRRRVRCLDCLRFGWPMVLPFKFNEKTNKLVWIPALSTNNFIYSMPAYIFVRASGFLGFGEVFRICAARKLFRLAGMRQWALKFKSPHFSCVQFFFLPRRRCRAGREGGLTRYFLWIFGQNCRGIFLRIFEPNYRFPANFQARHGVNPIK